MTERPDEYVSETNEPEERESVREDLPGTIGKTGPTVPVATGATTSYTTGTLEHGELGPAVDKPGDEGPTQGEGPISDPVQAEDTGE